jgi:hypothetical protein
MAAYGTDDGLQAWLTAQGLPLPPGATPATLREIGSAYVDAAYEARLQCSRRAGGFAQELAWPRAGHRVNGQPVPEDLIPPAWINASYRAAWLEASNPGWATGTTDPNRVVKREKVDVIEVEYFGEKDSAANGAASGIVADAIIGAWWLPGYAGTCGAWTLCSG